MSKASSRRAKSKTRQSNPAPVRGELGIRRRGTSVKPAGRGGRAQQAGGPRHRGLSAGEDRNP
jgi:hypothetical protein